MVNLPYCCGFVWDVMILLRFCITHAMNSSGNTEELEDFTQCAYGVGGERGGGSFSVWGTRLMLIN